MKKGISLLISFCFLGLFCFCQHQPIETLGEVMIGPNNVDVHYTEQVEFYVEKYSSTLAYLIELKASHEEELERLLGNKKTKFWNSGKIKEEKHLIELLGDELEVVGDFIFLWSDSKIGDKRENFEVEYDSTFCYDIFSTEKIYEAYEYQIMEDNREVLEWEEIIPIENFNIVEFKKIIRPAGKKWIRKRADKNCLSSDPNDCQVWCLVEVLPEVEVQKYYEGLPQEFETSKERKQFFRKMETEKWETKKYKLIDIRENFEIEVKDFKKVSCN